LEQYHQLTQNERYLIAQLRQQGVAARTIALRLGRHHSTVYREVKRNATTHNGAYRPHKAHVYAGARRWKARSKPQYGEQELERVNQLLREDLSPEQCCGVLREQGLSISWPTIYRHIRRDRREGGTLWRHLRIIPKFGRKRYRSKDSRGVLPGKRHISERPAGAARRSRRWHWEGDTVMGADGRHCVLTLVERKTGYVIIKKLSARNKEQVTAAIKQAIREHLGRFRTITLDNGTEFHDYKLIEWAYPVRCYFATPYHSWERGSNENMNGLIRQYLPKGQCLRNITQADCDWIANRLNHRPRKRFGFRTPYELFWKP
jgi:IS30 family transposase